MTVNKLLIIIDRYRARLPMEVDVLSQKAGLSRSTYKQWMNGTYRPTLQAVIQVLDVMGLELCIRRKKDAGQDMR